MALPLAYHWRNLFARRNTTLLTVLVIAAVVATLAWITGFGFALLRSLRVASDEHLLIVMRRGSTSESSSALPVAEYNKLMQVRGVAVDPATGEPLISPETLVQVSLPRLRDRGRTEANVAVRGVTPHAFQVHRNVKLVEGAMFSTGAQQVIVGRKAAQQFAGLKLGDTVNLGFGRDRGYHVVGYFTADGGPTESEIWGYLPSLLNAYNRTLYSSASVRLQPGAAVDEALAQIEGPGIEQTAKTEALYWREQTKLVRAYLFVVGSLVLIMAVAAVCSIANTMFSAVAGRSREIAMLRTIGFSRRQILAGFVFEAVLLGLLGGVVGCLACAGWLEVVGHTKDMYGSTSFTTMAFDIRLTPTIALAALFVVALVGAAGAFFPAWRASRVEMITALREA